MQTQKNSRKVNTKRLIAYQSAAGIVFGLCGAIFASSSASSAPITALYNIITVTSVTDKNPIGGKCTLREAVIATNTNTAVDGCVAGSAILPDEIVFDPATDGQPIVLDQIGPGEDAAATGDLDVTDQSLRIQGNGAGKTIIDGDLGDRVFHVLNNAHLDLHDLTIRNGAGVAHGGGVLSQSGTSLSLTSVMVTKNAAANTGGASGGGIEADGDFSMTTSFVVGNTVETKAQGVASGGGLYLAGTNPVNISLSYVGNNTATSAVDNAEAGGIARAGDLTLTDSAVTGNAVTAGINAYGGGIDMYSGVLALTRAELTNNMAQSTAASGFFVDGGGLNSGTGIALINTTVAGNQAKGGEGGGIYLYGGSSTTIGSTIARNSANIGGGIFVPGAQFHLSGSVLADNTASVIAPDCGDGDGIGHVSADEYNLVGISDGCTLSVNSATNQIGSAASPIDPKLGTLQVIAGAPTPTQVLPLLPGSPAIDAGDSILFTNGGTCYSPDQVGTARPQDDNGDGTAACDIGAVEYVQQPATSSGSGSSGGGAFGLLELCVLLGMALLAMFARGRNQQKLNRAAKDD